MSEWVDIVPAIAGLIREEPRTVAVLFLFGAAGAIFAAIIRKTQRNDSLCLR
ncbi:MAG TPA: hypothetical protein VHW09_14725 [Bryobacteraceae bacterium]|jgi:hypothetical protein|nr:hypothetical protein [Bryobacteraceae bacterium]